MMKMMTSRVLYVLLLATLQGCVQDYLGDGSRGMCIETPWEGINMMDLQEVYAGELTPLEEAHSFRAFVVSSDAQGNHFGALYLQDDPVAPSIGVELLMDLQDAHLYYPPGTEVEVHTAGLYLDRVNSGFRLGSVMPVFGERSVARIPARKLPYHLIPLCGDPEITIPQKLPLEGLSEEYINTLVFYQGVQFPEGDQGQALGYEGDHTLRLLTDCNANEGWVWISEFSEFRDSLVPAGIGSVTGVLRKDGSQFYIHPSHFEDLVFEGQSCNEGEDPNGDGEDQDGDEHDDPDDNPGVNGEVFISEIADPDNAPEARFIELANSGTTAADLNGWHLVRYTNANTDPGATIVLDSLVIEAGGVAVIAAEMEGFSQVFGFLPDLVGGTNSAAGSNGDDNIFLISPDGTVRDAFGRIGEDGSGTDHEFEDGRALRSLGVVRANPEFNPSEWVISNDSGGEGTTQDPKQAPGDFDPGSHL